LTLLLTGMGTSLAASGVQPRLRAIEVAAPTCKDEAFPMVPFLDSLRVELAGRGFVCCTLVDPESSPIGAEVLRVSLEIAPCEPESPSVRIGISDFQEAKVEHEVSLADVAATARPRALALAAAELIRSYGQLPPKEAPVVSQEPVPPPPPPEPAMASRLAVSAEGQIRLLPTRNTTLWGGRMRLTLPWRALYAQVDLGGDTTSAGTELGTVSLTTVGLGLGAGARFVGRSLILNLGPRFELGRAWIRGQANASEVGAGQGGGVVASLGLRAALETPAASRLRPGIALEGGGVLRGTKGESDGRTVLGITGYYFVGALAVAFSL